LSIKTDPSVERSVFVFCKLVYRLAWLESRSFSVGVAGAMLFHHDRLYRVGKPTKPQFKPPIITKIKNIMSRALELHFFIKILLIIKMLLYLVITRRGGKNKKTKST